MYYVTPRTNDNRYVRLKDILCEIDSVLDLELHITKLSSAPEAGQFPDATTAWPASE